MINNYFIFARHNSIDQIQFPLSSFWRLNKPERDLTWKWSQRRKKSMTDILSNLVHVLKITDISKDARTPYYLLCMYLGNYIYDIT